MTDPESPMDREGSAERGSSKHGPRLDEELAHETEGLVRGGGSTHAEEWKEPEPTEEAEEPRGRRGGAPSGMTPDDVTWRAEVAELLRNAGFPADRDRLVDHLDSIAAPDELVAAVADLPAARTYASPGEVVKALGVPRERGRQ